MFHSPSSFWGHSVHFANFPMLRFEIQKSTAPTFFIQFEPNFTESMQSGKIQAINFSDKLPNFKSIWQFEDKLPDLHCHYSYSYVGFM